MMRLRGICTNMSFLILLCGFACLIDSSVGAEVKDVTPMGSVILFNRLLRLGVPVQLHVLTRRGHGFANSRYPTLPAASWREQILEWMRMVKVL